MDVFTVAWIAWLVVFGVIEGVALKNRKQGDTLSEHVWKWFAVGRKGEVTTGVRARRVILLAFMAWLSVHFLTGGEFV